MLPFRFFAAFQSSPRANAAIVMSLVTSVCLSVSCTCSSFWKPYPGNFISGMQVGTSLEYLGHVCMSRSLGQGHRSRNGIYDCN